jgi:hypothetical protein
VSDESQELIGKVLKGRYRILSELGRGGMAIVYLCEDQDLGRKVVVKAPKKALAAESEFRQRFEREIKGQLGMEHPHICTVMDAETSGPFPYVVLQYLSGGDLSDKLKASKLPMPMKEILGWMPQVAKALDFIHSKGWVHRDVKPGNTMFDEYGNAFVGDFGIARAASSEDSMELTQTGALIGSPQYMAPDLMLGHELSPAYDQYALACMIYTSLSKRIPHQASTPIAIVHLRAIRPIPALSEYVKGVPKGIEAAVMKGLERDPKDRFDSCEEFYEAVRDASVRGATVPVSEPAGGEEPTMMIGAEEAAGATAISAESGTRIGAPVAAAAPSPSTGSSPMAATMLSPPPKKSGLGKLAAAVVIVGVLGAGGYFGWQFLSGGEPPVLAELAAEPGPPVASLGREPVVVLASGSAQLAGRFSGKAVKELRAVARPDGDPFYSNLPAPDLSCSTTSEHDFSCSFEGQPGRYRLELIASDGWNESTHAIDLKVGDSGLIPLPANSAGVALYERVADGARVVAVPAGDGVKGDYLLDEHEVTWRQYFRYLQSAGKHEAAVPDWATIDSPAVNVDWESARSYCEWAEARLPTADEWKRAASGDESRSFPWGSGWESGRANTADPDGQRFAAPAREFREGASPFGVLNMVGNVAEWVSTKSRKGQGLVYGGSFRDRGDTLGSTHAEAAPRSSISTSYGVRCAMGGKT